MDLDALLSGVTTRDWQDGEPDATLRLAVVGLGAFARQRALPAIAAADSCTVTVLVSRSSEKAAAWADEFGATRGLTVEAYDDGVAADDYDAVYVATPNARHRPVVETAARLGKAVLCEKPLEATAERAERLVAACEAAGVPLMTAYRMQLHPALRRMRSLVREGFVGDPVFVHGNFSTHSIHGDRSPEDWRYDRAIAGSGALGDIGVYPLNATRFVVEADPVDVAAVTRSPDAAFADVDEHVSVQATFPGALTATFTASFDAQGDSRLEVVGTDGAMVLEWAYAIGARRHLTLVRGHTEASVTVPPVDEVREEFDYFADRVLSGGEIEPDGRDGLRDVRVVEAALTAATDGGRVPID